MATVKDLRRAQRLSSLVRAELAKLLLEEVSDPSLKDILITDVQISKDLKSAKIFFIPQGEFSPKQEKETLKGFERASSFFRRKIGENLDLRFVPALVFERDLHGQSVSRLLHLFSEVENPPTHQESPQHE